MTTQEVLRQIIGGGAGAAGRPQPGGPGTTWEPIVLKAMRPGRGPARTYAARRRWPTT